MKSNISKNKTSATNNDAVLARHFLMLAEDATDLGDKNLANHFLEIAMELFEAGSVANIGTAFGKLPTLQGAGMQVS